MIVDNITGYMNALGHKTYTKYEASAIRNCIRHEYDQRQTRPRDINNRSKKGKKVINQRIVLLIKDRYGYDLSVADIEHYKKCYRLEYSDRTGRCIWGFKERRKMLGYNPDTGLLLGGA